jgi:uncharacterized membrane protein
VRPSHLRGASTSPPPLLTWYLWPFVAPALLNGDGASIVLFGTLISLALVGPRLIDAKRKRAYGERWTAFAAQTSVLPFAAIAAGHNRFVVHEIGGVVYMALIAGHRSVRVLACPHRQGNHHIEPSEVVAARVGP